MKTKKVVPVVSFLTVVSLSALALLLTVPPPVAVAAPPTKLAVFPPDSQPFGYSYGEWSAKWWQWALSLPADQNPFLDETGCSNGANGQAGPVWFLTGVMNVSGMAVRECTIPAGKALFFPILNTECSTIEVGTDWYGSNEAELCECAKGWMDLAKNLKCKIDGRAVGSLHQYRVQSPMFELTLPENNVWGMAPTTGQSVSDGVFLMVEPLPPGQHTIEFAGSLPGFTLHITYYLTVQAAP